MTPAVFFSHPASAGHETGAHPERAARIDAIERHLDEVGWFGFERREAPRVQRALLEFCHDPAYVAALERLCAAGGGQLDADTLVSEGSWEAAMRAAGGAVAVVDAVLAGEAVAAFSAGRPPGHHALRDRAMGFCMFNNVALAAVHALRAHGLERVLILDWDVHHGNGTNDIFHASAEVLYASIHESPLYPGTGAASDRGSGAGEGFTLNMPVPAGSGDAVFCELLDTHVIPRARAVSPAADSDLGRLRRARRGSARELPGDRSGLCGDDDRDAPAGRGARGAARRRARRWLRARSAGSVGRRDARGAQRRRRVAFTTTPASPPRSRCRRGRAL